MSNDRGLPPGGDQEGKSWEISVPPPGQRGQRPPIDPPSTRPVTSVPRQTNGDTKTPPAPVQRASVTPRYFLEQEETKKRPAPPPRPAPVEPQPEPEMPEELWEEEEPTRLRPRRTDEEAAREPRLPTDDEVVVREERDEKLIGVGFEQRKRANVGCLRGALYFVLILITSIVLAVNMWSWVDDVLALTTSGEGMVEIYVPEGYSYSDISAQLKEQGVIKHSWLFNLYCDFSGADEKIVAQEEAYRIDATLDYRAIVYAMRPVIVREEVRIQFREGMTLDEMLALLEENKVCSREDMMKAFREESFNFSFLESLPEDAETLEGFMFPDTYDFYTNESARTVIRRFLNNFDKKLSPSMRSRVEDMDYTLYEIIIVASLVEAEATATDRKRVASVIYNRLESANFPTLDIDATVIYALGGKRDLTLADLEVDSPYNTYVYEGLPIGPICSPSIAAIRAALYPEETGYYYYALTDNGTHAFSKTYAEHQKVIRDNPETYGGRN